MFRRMKRRSCAAVIGLWAAWALAVSACSGKSAEGPSEPTTQAAEAQDKSQGKPQDKNDREAKRKRALAALKARQQAACEQMSEILTDCAVQDARKQMSPKELAELDLENTAPRHRAEVQDQCLAVDMSPRQVRVIESCLAKDTACTVFLPCLDAAQGKPSQPTQ